MDRFRVTAPIRICDLGGWTDTWFGGPGRVLNLAVEPGVTIEAMVSTGSGRAHLDLVGLGEKLTWEPAGPRPGRHPLLEAALSRVPPPHDVDLEVRIASAVPPGAATGTSAAVLVALLTALAVAAGDPIEPVEAARLAHVVETADLGGESGVQDQLAAAYGGINWIVMDTYPYATAERLPDWDGLDRHLSLVYLGRPHDSSALHTEVIAGGGGGRSEVLERLRQAAWAGRRAVLARRPDLLAKAMVANTDAQSALHPALVGSDARLVWEAARRAEATGWKVNGAGGSGGSLTLLSPTPEARAAVESCVAAALPEGRILPVRISPRGVSVTPL